MLAPVRVEHLHHHTLLDVTERFHAHLLFLGGILRPQQVDHMVYQIDALAGGILGHEHLHIHVHAKIVAQGIGCTSQVPLRFNGLGRDMCRDGVGDDFAAEVPNNLGNLGRLLQLEALGVNHLALIVGDVVVLQQVLAKVEVVRLHLALGTLDLASEQRTFDSFARTHAHARQQRLHTLRVPEDTHEVVFERQIEPA